MSKTKWAMIKPGTVIHGTGWRNEGNTHTFTDADTKLRYCVSRENDYRVGEVWAVVYQGNTWRFGWIRLSSSRKERERTLKGKHGI